MTNIYEARKRLKRLIEDRFCGALELQEIADVQAVLDALDAAEEGLYRVYVELGEDTDGARNARELFGPMTGATPGVWVPKLVREYRAEMEAEVDAAERARDEALEKEREAWNVANARLDAYTDATREMHARELHHFEEEQRTAGLAAVVERVKANLSNAPECDEHPDGDPITCGWKSDMIHVRKALSAVPADVLRERDAETGARALREAADFMEQVDGLKDNAVARWLRARAEVIQTKEQD